MIGILTNLKPSHNFHKGTIPLLFVSPTLLLLEGVLSTPSPSSLTWGGTMHQVHKWCQVCNSEHAFRTQMSIIAIYKCFFPEEGSWQNCLVKFVLYPINSPSNAQDILQ